MAFKIPNLLPKEDKFCVLLRALSAEACGCAKHLGIFIDGTDSGERALANQAINNSRAQAKRIAADITRELCRTFITPFDREDIQDFATELYNIPKAIEKVRNRVIAHGLQADHSDFSRQIEVIVQEAEAMEAMIDDLITHRNNEQVQAKIAILYDLEEKGDKVLGELLVELFSSARNAHELILRKDIYDMLERIIDRYRDAAGIALQMVLKHT